MHTDIKIQNLLKQEIENFILMLRYTPAGKMLHKILKDKGGSIDCHYLLLPGVWQRVHQILANKSHFVLPREDRVTNMRYELNF